MRQNTVLLLAAAMLLTTGSTTGKEFHNVAKSNLISITGGDPVGWVSITPDEEGQLDVNVHLNDGAPSVLWTVRVLFTGQKYKPLGELSTDVEGACDASFKTVPGTGEMMISVGATASDYYLSEYTPVPTREK